MLETISLRDERLQLAVRGLAAALAQRQGRFLGREVHRRAREHFVDIAAHDAATVGAVPIAFDNDSAAALGAGFGWGLLESGHGDSLRRLLDATV